MHNFNRSSSHPVMAMICAVSIVDQSSNPSSGSLSSPCKSEESWLTLWEAQSGKRGGGGGSGMVGISCFFLEAREEGKNKVGPKNCNAPWSIGHLLVCPWSARVA